LIAEAIEPYLAHAADMLSELEKMTIQQSVSTVTKQLHRLETVCEQKFFKSRALDLRSQGLPISDADLDNAQQRISIVCETWLIRIVIPHLDGLESKQEVRKQMTSARYNIKFIELGLRSSQ